MAVTILLLHEVSPVSSFTPVAWVSSQLSSQRASSTQLYSTTEKRKRKPSRVTDEDGPTPDLPDVEIEEVGDIPELRETKSASEMPPGPIPHQPWRRGETAGCEDPISAEWRVEAEEIMKKAAKLAGGKVIDVTWYLTSVLVTLDEDLSDAKDMLKSSGPVIEVVDPSDPIYYDPKDPKPEDIWTDEDDVVYQRETEEERKERLEKKRNMYATKDEDDPEEEPHIPEEDDDTDEVGLYMNEESRGDAALTAAEEAKTMYDEEEKPVNLMSLPIDRSALSSIAGAMIEALEEVEDELMVLSRHELVLTSPGPADILECQMQFDAHRGDVVLVETQDPWQSNRVLKGKLMDRNSMDVIINKKGRMVTIPNNFVRCVRLAVPPKEGEELSPEEYEEYEEEYVEEE